MAGAIDLWGWDLEVVMERREAGERGGHIEDCGFKQDS